MLEHMLSLIALLGTLAVSPLLFAQPPASSTPAANMHKIASQQRRIGQPAQTVQYRPLQRVAHPKPPQPEPCWKVAGISQETMARRRSIEQQTHQRVRQICANSSLSDQQKREQIQEVRKAANEEILGLTTPEQRAALKQCNQERAQQHAASHPAAQLPRPLVSNPHPHPGGPCG